MRRRQHPRARGAAAPHHRARSAVGMVPEGRQRHARRPEARRRAGAVATAAARLRWAPGRARAPRCRRHAALVELPHVRRAGRGCRVVRLRHAALPDRPRRRGVRDAYARRRGGGPRESRARGAAVGARHGRRVGPLGARRRAQAALRLHGGIRQRPERCVPSAARQAHREDPVHHRLHADRALRVRPDGGRAQRAAYARGTARQHRHARLDRRRGAGFARGAGAGAELGLGGSVEPPPAERDAAAHPRHRHARRAASHGGAAAGVEPRAARQPHAAGGEDRERPIRPRRFVQTRRARACTRASAAKKVSCG